MDPYGKLNIYIFVDAYPMSESLRQVNTGPREVFESTSQEVQKWFRTKYRNEIPVKHILYLYIQYIYMKSSCFIAIKKSSSSSFNLAHKNKICHGQGHIFHSPAIVRLDQVTVAKVVRGSMCFSKLANGRISFPLDSHGSAMWYQKASKVLGGGCFLYMGNSNIVTFV